MTMSNGKEIKQSLVKPVSIAMNLPSDYHFEIISINSFLIKILYDF